MQTIPLKTSTAFGEIALNLVVGHATFLFLVKTSSDQAKLGDSGDFSSHVVAADLLEVGRCLPWGL